MNSFDYLVNKSDHVSTVAVECEDDILLLLYQVESGLQTSSGLSPQSSSDPGSSDGETGSSPDPQTHKQQQALLCDDAAADFLKTIKPSNYNFFFSRNQCVNVFMR